MKDAETGSTDELHSGEQDCAISSILNHNRKKTVNVVTLLIFNHSVVLDTQFSQNTLVNL